MKQFRRQENAKIQPGANHESKGVSLSSRSTVSLQPELEMTQPGDAYEQEADKMADRILDHAFAAASPTPYASRPVISRAPSGYASVSVPPSVEAAISSSRGSGFPMPSALKARMESGFGADFSQVRFHTDNAAAQMSSSIRANAFTSGSDVYFASGKYDPSSRSGQHLIAHELTHTLQQSGKVARESSDGGGVNLQIPVRNSVQSNLLKKEKDAKENRCQLYLYYILTHDPEIVKTKLDKDDAKVISRNFTGSINSILRAWEFEHILDEKNLKTAEKYKESDGDYKDYTDWLTDFLAKEYKIFQSDYEGALERALVTLAERRFELYSPKKSVHRLDNYWTSSEDPIRARIYKSLLDETAKDEYTPTPYMIYLSRRYSAFSKRAPETTQSFAAVNAQKQKEKDEREREIKEKEQRENDEYAAFFKYLLQRFFPESNETYWDYVWNREITVKDLGKAFGYNENIYLHAYMAALGVATLMELPPAPATKRDIRMIRHLWEAMMEDLARKKGGNPNDTQSMANAYDRVWEQSMAAGDKFKGYERFVSYERQLLEYIKDKSVYWYDYFELPDFYVSAETCTRVFFTIMTVALSFIPVGAFAGLGGCVAKAAHFFTNKIIPRLVEIALNESYRNAAYNDAEMDLLTNALEVGVEALFGKLPVACESKVGQLLEGAAKDSLQTFATGSSGYLVKYVYGDDVGNWAMITTKGAMEAFAMNLGKGILKEGVKKLAFNSDVQAVKATADKANLDLSEGKITQSDYDDLMARVDQTNDNIDASADFMLQVGEEGVGVVDNALGVSKSITKVHSTQDSSSQEPVSPVFVVPVEELFTIDQL